MYDADQEAGKRISSWVGIGRGSADRTLLDVDACRFSTLTFIARKTGSISRDPDIQDWPAWLSGIAGPACQTIPSQGRDRRPVLTKEYSRFIDVGCPYPDAASLSPAIVRHLEMKRVGNRLSILPLSIFAVQPVVVPHWCPPSRVKLARFRVYNLVTSVARSRRGARVISARLRLRSGRRAFECQQ